MIRWEEPGYVVAFTTRAGGVSRGVYESLNLTPGPATTPQLVEENRRIACAALGARRRAARVQPPGALADRPPGRAGQRGEPGDGLWTRRAGLPLLAMSADCLPIAIARRDGRRRARGAARRLARPRGGRRRGRGRSARRRARRPRWSGRRSARAATRSATRCAALFDAGSDRRREARPLERRRARAARRGRRDGRARRPVHALPSRALLLAPAERPGARRPGGDRCCRLTRSARASSACRRTVGPAVTVVAATKYVGARRHGAARSRPASPSSGRTARRISRRSTPSTATRSRWHFIGHLQSNKVKVVNRICELVHSLDSESAARRLEVPGARPGEPLRRGVEVGRRAGRDRRAISRYDVRGLSTMPPAAASPERLRRVVRAAARARRGARPRASSRWARRRTTRWPPKKGATHVRVGSILFRD